MRKTVLAYGEALWDLLPSGPQLGGAPFNFAYRVDSLGDSGAIVTRLGRDDLGWEAHDRIVELEMETRFVQWDDEAPTGTVEVDLTDPNNPDFTIVPDVAYDNIEATDELIEAAREADCVCYGTLAQRTEKGRETLAALLEAASRPMKLLDINLRRDCYTSQTVTSSLERADVLKLNDQEAKELTRMLDMGASSIPAFAEAIIGDWDLTQCVLTFGERGAFAADGSGQKAYVPGYRVGLVDTCGSGDAFTAGFIRRLLRERPLVECCILGNALGAMVATQDGATAPILLEEVEEFLAAEHERVLEPSLEQFSNV
ncbi:MAG: carbohydrate kinase [Candidatus Brocadiaceae bacterium]|jgi:fructokinase